MKVDDTADRLKADAFDVLSDMVTKVESDEDIANAVYELVYTVDACLYNLTDGEYCPDRPISFRRLTVNQGA